MTGYELHGIPGSEDPRYDRPVTVKHPGWLCPVCRQHPVEWRWRRCDLEVARAAEMDDPRWCLRCARAFDRRSCPVTLSAQGRRDLCGECQGVPSPYRVVLGPVRMPRRARRGSFRLSDGAGCSERIHPVERRVLTGEFDG